MNRRQWMKLSGAAATAGRGAAWQAAEPGPLMGNVTPDKLLLKDYRPVPIYKIPQTDIKRAKYPIVDAHCHGARPPQQVDEMVKLMDAVNVEKTVIFTGAATPQRFNEVRQPYAKHPGRFDLWCSFDLTGVAQPGFGPGAVKALEEGHRLGGPGGRGNQCQRQGLRVRGPGRARGPGRHRQPCHRPAPRRPAHGPSLR